MSGFSFAYNNSSVMGTVQCIPVLVGKSTLINPGDVLVETINSTYTGTTTSQYPVVRPLLSGDTVTTSNGLLGVALFGLQTNSSGVIISKTSSVTVDTRGKLDTSMSYMNDLPTDPVSGYLRIFIASFASENVFSGITNANDVANFYTVGRVAGVTASAATFPSNYTVDIGAATANSPLYVEQVDTEYPQFNSANGAGRVFVKCLPAFYQGDTGVLWTT